MRKRISTLLIAVLALAAFGGVTGAANAKQGADDPAGHVRQSHGADDSKAGAKRRAHHRAHHARHGADDRAGHVRHGGADDGPNHG